MLKTLILKLIISTILLLFYVGCGHYTDPEQNSSDSGNPELSVNNSENNHNDKLPPTVLLVSPSSESIITDVLTPLKFDIHDNVNGVGLNQDSIKITFTNTGETFPLVVDDELYYTYTPSSSHPLSYGNIPFTVYAEDIAGNKVSESLSIFIQQKNVLSATPIATPSTAYAPAVIHFSPKVTTANAIVKYEWDFDGDGVYETSTITPNNHDIQFKEVGDYTISFKVVESTGKEAIGKTTVHILNAPPKVTVTSIPSNGSIPLTVNFKVIASDNEGIALYEWDFDGDGTYDFQSKTESNSSHTYTSIGIFNAKVRVTDTKGVSTVYTTPATKVYALTTGSPSVTTSASTQVGKAPLKVDFTATVKDPQNKDVAFYEWDYDGDGTYDSKNANSVNSHIFAEAGTFYPKLKVTMADGRVTYDALEVKVKNSISLTIKSDTIDSSLSETASIHTKTAAKLQMKLVIEDESYNPVKIIQDWTIRDAGEYDDLWDGTNESGNVVKEGKYYAVLLYKENGEEKRFDRRLEPRKPMYPASRTTAPRSFAPYDNRPLKITFTLDHAAEVISYMGYSWSDMRIVTFRNRQPLGKGSYEDIWYSQNENGQFISPPPGKFFMYGVSAYPLAKNAIFVKSGVDITNLSLSPTIFTPDSHQENGKNQKLKIKFTLNKPASIELEFYDASEGVLVATRYYEKLGSGEQTIEFDGKDNKGVYLHPGKYSLGIRAVDDQGYRSIKRYIVTRIKY